MTSARKDGDRIAARSRRSMGRTSRLRLMAGLIACAGVLGSIAICASAQAALPNWKPIAATAPTHIAPKQSELQRVTVEGANGSFRLTAKTKGEGTPVVANGSLTFVAGSAVATIESVEPGAEFQVGDRVTFAHAFENEVERIVLACSSDCKTPGSTITLSMPASSNQTSAAVEIFTKDIVLTSGTFVVGEEMFGSKEFAPGAFFEKYFDPGTTVTAIGPNRITLSKPTTFEYLTSEGALELVGTGKTPAIPYNAPPATVEAGLEALHALGPGSVNVEGGPGGDSEHPYFVKFTGAFAEQNVEQLGADGTELMGANAAARVFTLVPGGPGTGELAIGLVNGGGAASTGEIKLEVHLPPEVLTGGPAVTGGDPSEFWSCPGGAGEATVVCTNTGSVPASSLAASLNIPLEVGSSSAFSSAATITISGGGASPASESVPVTISDDPARPGIQAFWAGAFDSNGASLSQAGGHPYSGMTAFVLNTVRSASGTIVPAGDLKDVDVDLPPGFLGNPLTTPRCPQSLVIGHPEPPVEGGAAQSPPLCNEAMVAGALAPFAAHSQYNNSLVQYLFNDVPAVGTAAEFTAEFVQPFQSLVGSVRSAEDFGVRITAPNAAPYESVFGAAAILYGMPAAANGKAFLVNPSDCAVQREEAVRGDGPATRIAVNTWQEPTVFAHASSPLPLLTGCRALTEAWLGQGQEPQNEEPSFSFQPLTNQGSSPTGATARLHIPQAGLSDPNKLATSDLKKAVVTLPQGLSVNPSAANGLESCSEAQVGFVGTGFVSPNPIHFDEKPVSCPDASKLGTFEIKTPLLEEEVAGTIYLASQEENPFHSLIALYLVVESARFGLVLKLPGEVKPDPSTGQLTATFDNNPQLPFEDLTLRFRGGGGRSTLATPEVCGHYETTGSLEPWSAENGEALPISEAGFSTVGTCASSESARPFSPSFEAGTAGTQAGAYSPLVIKINRKDGEQELKNIDFTLPKGLTAKLAGVEYCPEESIRDAEGKSGRAEQASASCPAASRIGSVDTAAGVGSEPIHVPGAVYLAGPYKGAPLSSVVITPAVAGPFDLGNVVVRAPLFVNPETAEITAKSDPIPTILKGIPLKVRSVSINVDRSDFSLDPTNCESMTASASIAGSNGASAGPVSRFQVGGCDKLKFKPKLQLSLKGSTKRIGHPALKAVVTYPKNGAYANIARAQVNLPHSEFLDQGNLNKTCTKPVVLACNCPKKSIYGKAKAWTPLLAKPLEGPVYLVGGYGYKLPALVAELNGQIRVLLVGKVDSGPNKGIRNTFEAVPDAPVEKFVLEMKGGKKYGLLENSENLCKNPQRANVSFAAQNGLVQQTKPLVGNDCGKGKGKGKKNKKGKR